MEHLPICYHIAMIFRRPSRYKRCCAIRNKRPFCILKRRLKHVFYNKKPNKKRIIMKCRQTCYIGLYRGVSSGRRRR
jgi:hypothetical protein